MGNIFSYFLEKKDTYKDSLMTPLNEEYEYASIIDFNNINSQVNILEETTQSSLKNISKDVKYLFEQLDIIKDELKKFNENNKCINQYQYQNENDNENESIYYEPNNNDFYSNNLSYINQNFTNNYNSDNNSENSDNEKSKNNSSCNEETY